MHSAEELLIPIIKKTVHDLYSAELNDNQLQLQKTRKEFEGHITLVVFPLLRISKKKPEQTAEEIGETLLKDKSVFSGYNVIKGFLNLILSYEFWLKQFNESLQEEKFGINYADENSPLVMVEYSSPNTNKPLHLGHIRNNLLGASVCNIIEANGNRVVKTNIVNDRGIHICKSMLAWQKWGNGETPQSSGKKGDHLVGEYYVKFDKRYKEQVAEMVENGLERENAEQQAPLIVEAREMLRKWEEGDKEVVELWKTMNEWVYQGFDQTYKRMGVAFDKIYYESNTYKTGRDEVLRGLNEGIFQQREDNSVWADLTPDGLDQKILLRSDGTSVYMTQDIGTAKMRYEDFTIDKMIYVVGNEQNYHFKVLALLLDKLGYEWGKNLVHYSYGMVELPEGKMKSREGTVVDADDLMEEMVNVARETSKELGKLDDYTEEEKEKTFEVIALGALKYFILKVDPKKTMLFNPKESIDFNGNTGPFIQYTHARIKSVLRKAADMGIEITNMVDNQLNISEKESALLHLLLDFPTAVKNAGSELSPALIANYIYDLAKEFNQFYHDFSILKESDTAIRGFRLNLSLKIASVLQSGANLLGMHLPEKM